MSNTTNTTSKAPSHIVYHVRDAGEQKSFWNRIGAAWAHADGQGLNIQLDCIPVDGRISVRVATEKKD